MGGGFRKARLLDPESPRCKAGSCATGSFCKRTLPLRVACSMPIGHMSDRHMLQCFVGPARLSARNSGGRCTGRDRSFGGRNRLERGRFLHFGFGAWTPRSFVKCLCCFCATFARRRRCPPGSGRHPSPRIIPRLHRPTSGMRLGERSAPLKLNFSRMFRGERREERVVYVPVDAPFASPPSNPRNPPEMPSPPLFQPEREFAPAAPAIAPSQREETSQPLSGRYVPQYPRLPPLFLDELRARDQAEQATRTASRIGQLNMESSAEKRRRADARAAATRSSSRLASVRVRRVKFGAVHVEPRQKPQVL